MSLTPPIGLDAPASSAASGPVRRAGSGALRSYAGKDVPPQGCRAVRSVHETHRRNSHRDPSSAFLRSLESEGAVIPYRCIFLMSP